MKQLYYNTYMDFGEAVLNTPENVKLYSPGSP